MDTVPIGKSMYEVKLIEKTRGNSNRFAIAMCVENNYGKQVFVDSFYNDNKKPKTNSLKLGLINTSEGNRIVKGFILQEFHTKEYVTDSTFIVHKRSEKMYVRENVYVLDKRK